MRGTERTHKKDRLTRPFENFQECHLAKQETRRPGPHGCSLIGSGNGFRACEDPRETSGRNRTSGVITAHLSHTCMPWRLQNIFFFRSDFQLPHRVNAPVGPRTAMQVLDSSAAGERAPFTQLLACPPLRSLGSFFFDPSFFATERTSTTSPVVGDATRFEGILTEALYSELATWN
jgi:hypothetical protein